MINLREIKNTLWLGCVIFFLSIFFPTDIINKTEYNAKDFKTNILMMESLQRETIDLIQESSDYFFALNVDYRGFRLNCHHNFQSILVSVEGMIFQPSIW